MAIRPLPFAICALALGMPMDLFAQWQPQGAAVVPAASNVAPAMLPPTVVPSGVAPAVGYNSSNVFGPQFAGAYIPQMPPPPSQPTTSLSYSRIQLAQATTVPPVVTGPPVAQGFGTSVAPAPVAPAYVAPPPGAGLVQTPGWGVPTIVPSQYVKFVQSVRLRHTWLAGDKDPNEFGINDSELAATFAFPNFLLSQQPLLITPGFILHLWDPPALGGPPSPFAGVLDGELPPRIYSAYLDFYWTPQLTERLSTELDFRIGLYSDFESAGSNAIRPQGYGAFIWQVSPAWALKGGATYINRVDIKLLPVAGVIWTPNPYTVFDITFPNPKLSHFAWRWGTTDVWWYIAGEYGGGSWEIDNISAAGMMNGGQRVDVNDIRAIAGLEWTGGWIGAKGFLEVGYVFEREVIFQAAPGVVFKPKDTVMVRGGFAF